MKIENQVCTLEQARRLKELGFEQNSLFHFDLDIGEFRPNELIQLSANCKRNYKCCSAFTVAELGEMLGNGRQVDISTFNPTKGKFYIYGTSNDFDYYDTEAQARAAKLIDAIERDFITVDEVNQRLQEI